MKEKLMIIDGNSIMNRAFYGLQGSRLLSTSDGLYTNAIYGFLNILFRYMEEENPNYICVAFDLKSPTFRHEQFDEYKANREGMPDELGVQVPVLKEVLEAMNIKRIEIEGFEADDILGTIAKSCENQDIQTIIVTGDKDSFQLISDKTKVKIPVTRGGKTETQDYTLEKFIEKYNIQPEQFIDVKGIMGDKSDNIPGVPGVGEKTALKLIRQYENIENILEKTEQLEVSKRIKQNIIDNKEQAILSKKLVTIDTSIPIDASIEEYKVTDFDEEKLYSLLKRLEFKSFIEKLNLKGKQDLNLNVQVLEKAEDVENIVNKIFESKQLIYNFEFDINNKNKILGIGVYFDDIIKFIPINQDNAFLNLLKPIFEDNSIGKIGYDLKHDMVALNSYGIGFNNAEFDIMIATYLLNPSRDTYSLSSIAQEYLDVSILSHSEFWNKIEYNNLNIQELANFVVSRVYCISKLMKTFKDSIKENEQEELFYKIELPLVEVLASMEINGFKIDKQQLLNLSQELEQKIELLMKEIYELAGEEFNVNSPKQLGHILFEKLNLPVVKKTKTGYSTNAEVLETLKPKHAIVEKILEYRQLVKLKTTYADGLLNAINPETGKVHSRFNQTVTQTGRISSTEPNLQNIPVKLEMGRKFRKVFIARDEQHKLLDADYSQIELRVLAHIADDKNMIDAFENNEDIHTRTASQVFDVDINEVTHSMRSKAKAVNFGIVYGIGDFSLAKDLGITKKEAKRYIESYLNNFTGVQRYMQEIVEIGKIKGYITTLLNRRRYLPELKSKNFNIRSFGERVAMNTPIQGTAADIIKIAMVNVYKELQQQGLKSKLILQIHDELIIDTHKDEIEKVKQIVYEQMMNAINLKVSLEIDMNVGYSWYEAK